MKHPHTARPVFLSPVRPVAASVVGICLLVVMTAGARESPEEVILRFGGDCLLAHHYEVSANGDPDRAFRELWHLGTADVAMVNLECPVTRRGTAREKPFTFRMDARFLSALTSAGVDIVNLANNHIFDFDSVGLADTIHNLDSAGVRHVGAGLNESLARKPVMMDVKGRRIAFFGYYSGSEAPVAGASSPGVAERSLPVVREDVAVARASGAEIIVANLHWGVEKAVLPEPEQVAFARAMVDLGVDVVVGHHPHVLQPIEYYKRGIIAYSLGNLVFGGNSRHTYETALLEIGIGAASIRYSVLPVQVRNYGARYLEGSNGARLIDSLNTLSSLLGND